MVAKLIELYKLTNGNGQTRGAMAWEVGTTHRLPRGRRGTALCSKEVLHAYRGANLALLMNPIGANFRPPRLWRIRGDVRADDGTKVGSWTQRVEAELPLPTWWAKPGLRHRVHLRFALLASQGVNAEKPYMEVITAAVERVIALLRSACRDETQWKRAAAAARAGAEAAVGHVHIDLRGVGPGPPKPQLLGGEVRRQFTLSGSSEARKSRHSARARDISPPSPTPSGPAPAPPRGSVSLAWRRVAGLLIAPAAPCRASCGRRRAAHSRKAAS